MSIDNERAKLRYYLRDIESEMTRLLVQSHVTAAQLRDTYLTRSEQDVVWEVIDSHGPA